MLNEGRKPPLPSSHRSGVSWSRERWVRACERSNRQATRHAESEFYRNTACLHEVLNPAMRILDRRRRIGGTEKFVRHQQRLPRETQWAKWLEQAYADQAYMPLMRVCSKSITP